MKTPGTSDGRVRPGIVVARHHVRDPRVRQRRRRPRVPGLLVLHVGLAGARSSVALTPNHTNDPDDMWSTPSWTRPSASLESIQSEMRLSAGVTSPAHHEQTLREVGLRVTSQRVAVLDAVRRLPHGDTDSLINAVRAETGDISHQAVYDVLRGAHRGRADPADPAARARSRATRRRVGDNHHHVVCRSLRRHRRRRLRRRRRTVPDRVRRATAS